MKLLIVEDSPILANKLAEMMTEVPDLEIVGTAGSVGEGALLTPLVHPDVIVVDLQISGGTGLDVLRFAKSNWKEIAVIILTNNASAFIREACLKAGADFFVDKSNELGELLAILSKIREKRGKRASTTVAPESAALAPDPRP